LCCHWRCTSLACIHPSIIEIFVESACRTARTLGCSRARLHRSRDSTGRYRLHVAALNHLTIRVEMRCRVAATRWHSSRSSCLLLTMLSVQLASHCKDGQRCASCTCQKASSPALHVSSKCVSVRLRVGTKQRASEWRRLEINSRVGINQNRFQI
jgi:hypothetical protein